jgi:hypothetical protein
MHQGRHLGAEQFDRAQRVDLRHAGQVHLETLPVVPQVPVQVDDPLGDLRGPADEVGPARRRLGQIGLAIGHLESALPGDPAHGVDPVGKEPVDRLAVIGDESHARHRDLRGRAGTFGLLERPPVQVDQRGEPGGLAADDGVIDRQPENTGPDGGLWVPAGRDRDPQVLADARLVVRAGQDHRLVQRRAELPRPGNGVPGVDGQQQLDLLVEQGVIVVQFRPEQRVGLDERPAARHQLHPPPSRSGRWSRTAGRPGPDPRC